MAGQARVFSKQDYAVHKTVSPEADGIYVQPVVTGTFTSSLNTVYSLVFS